MISHVFGGSVGASTHGGSIKGLRKGIGTVGDIPMERRLLANSHEDMLSEMSDLHSRPLARLK
jgi:hypothetical protein